MRHTCTNTPIYLPRLSFIMPLPNIADHLYHHHYTPHLHHHTHHHHHYLPLHLIPITSSYTTTNNHCMLNESSNPIICSPFFVFIFCYTHRIEIVLWALGWIGLLGQGLGRAWGLCQGLGFGIWDLGFGIWDLDNCIYYYAIYL